MTTDPKTLNPLDHPKSAEKESEYALTIANMAGLGLGLMALVGGLLSGMGAVWAMLIAVLTAAAAATGVYGLLKEDAVPAIAAPATVAANPEPEQNVQLQQRTFDGLVRPCETRLSTHDIDDPQLVASNSPSLVHANGCEPRPLKRAGRATASR